jgi:glycosyl transferase family 25
MRSYLINLDRAPQRLEWMTAQFAKIGAPFDRIEAIDGRLLGKEQIERHSTTRTPSEVGCFLSHRACWRRIADGDDEYAAVFEDDMHLNREIAHFLRSTEWIPPGVDIVKLEATGTKRYKADGTNIGAPFRLVEIGLICNGSGAYVISRALAARLANLDHFILPVDVYLFSSENRSRGFVAYETVPATAIQDSILNGSQGLLPSMIDGERTYPTRRKLSASQKVLRELLRPLRQVPKALDKIRRIRSSFTIRFQA